MFKVIILIFALIQPAEDDYGPDPVYVDPYTYDCGGDSEPDIKIEVRYIP